MTELDIDASEKTEEPLLALTPKINLSDHLLQPEENGRADPLNYKLTYCQPIACALVSRQTASNEPSILCCFPDSRTLFSTMNIVQALVTLFFSIRGVFVILFPIH
jgi:hypothetical protein